MKTKIHVKFDDRETSVMVDHRDEYGFARTIGQMQDAAIEQAVRKLYGKRCFWFANADMPIRGQVFEALRPTKRNSNPGNTAKTKTIMVGLS